MCVSKVEVLKRAALVRLSDASVGIPGPGTMDGYVCVLFVGAAAPSMMQTLKRMMKRRLNLNIFLLGGHLGIRS